ncbi:MAG TPA: FlgD immunoglobulin-like domain containing protein [Candidatus Cloacimonadota bacterium]|nr:FlgD immunoglobulin-like domain containing protein [Candidatus Cloacimonadota bacterium]
MTKSCLLTIGLLLIAATIFAQGQPGRNPPPYSFTRTPLTLMTSYYDYMIGSYHNTPLLVHPTGGYIMTYHGAISNTSLRRVFYARVNAAGELIGNDYLDDIGPNREGYPALAIDPVSGAVLYAWHEDFDADEALEIRFVADMFGAGFPGSFNSYQTVVDNPITITSPAGNTANNQFLWPSLVIGTSPVPGKRRVYLLSRDVGYDDPASCSNVYLAYADFNSDDLQPGNLLTWTYRSVPLLDTWFHDPLIHRSVSLAITCDDAGNVYLCGNRYTYTIADNMPVAEPDLNIFVCANYGAGDWQDLHFNSDLPSWNPNSAPADTTGYFKTEDGQPFSDSALKWKKYNSSHFNISLDNEGRIHIPALWNYYDGVIYHVYDNRELQYLKEAIFDPATQQLRIKDVYPQKDPGDDYNSCYQPWDTVAPWGVEDGWTETNDGYIPNMQKNWNYGIWDEEGHPGDMMFRCNNLRITKANDHGMMAMVWQSSLRARYYHVYDDPAYADYQNAPEIMISVSPDNGNSWSEPISLNRVETPEMAGMMPLWVYAADQVIYTGEVDGHATGKLGLMFFNDCDWIAVVLPPQIYLSNLGGQVMFAELQITFPLPSAGEDPVDVPMPPCLSRNYPNPFRESTTLHLNLPRSEPISLNIYNLRGQLVKTLYHGYAAKGETQFEWDGTDGNGASVASGIYFVRLQRAGRSETMKLMRVK